MAEPRHLPATRPVYDVGQVERAEVDAVYLPSTLPNLADLEIIDRIADRAAKSAYIAGARTPERAAMLILAGRELRVGPWQALSGIHIIKERPSISAHLMGALVQRFIREQRGGVFRATEQTSERCTIEYRRPEWDTSSFVTWTIEDARRAGLGVGQGDSNWHKFPRQMLFSRATGEAARSGFPDVVQGLYTPEELEDVPYAPPSGEVAPAVAARVVETTPDDTPAPPSQKSPRRIAADAVFAWVGEAMKRGQPDDYKPDSHAGTKALQAYVYEHDARLRDASFREAEVWTESELREFRRRLTEMHPADLAAVLAAVIHPEPETVEIDGSAVEVATGEIVEAPPPDAPDIDPEEAALIQWRDVAGAARSPADWTAMFAEAGANLAVWGVFVQAADSVQLLRNIAKAAKAAGVAMPALVGAIEMREAQIAKRG
jgi:hypothetical protein